MDSDYSEAPVMDMQGPHLGLDGGTLDPLPGLPQRGTGRKRGRPKGSGRGRAAKGASPSPSPKPGPPRPPAGYGGYPPHPGGYGGYPPHPQGYPQGDRSPGPRPGYPPQGYGGPRPNSNGPPPPGSNGPQNPKFDPTNPGEYPPNKPTPHGDNPEGPPPPPSKHEGPPASTWTPPIHNRPSGQKGPPNSLPPSGPPSETEGGQSGSDDGRPESAEPGVRPSSSPRPRPSPSPRPRPSPSPTGSSSSRSMSPAIGQSREGSVSMPPRPASGASEGNGPTSMNSSMASPAPGGPQGYPSQPNMGPPHMYKGHGPPPPGQGVPPYGHGYPGYPGQRPGYGAPGPYGPGPGPYGPRPGGPGGPPGQYPGYPGQGQYPPQGWNGPNMAGKGGPPPGQPGGPPGHPGMRMGGPPGGPGYGPPGQGRPYPGGPPSSYNGPSFNGPNMPPPGSSSPGMGPPPVSSPGIPPGGYPPSTGAPPPGGYPSPSSTPNSLPPSSTPTPVNDSSAPASDSVSGSNTTTTNSVGGRITSIETTGPDGQPMHDETSQQSTLSQSSDNSGGRQTPKGGYTQGYAHAPGTPHSAPSPGSMGSSQEDAPVGSPHGWGRIPASPVGTPGPQAKVENLQRLYEIDDDPTRRAWLDKLLAFMEDRGTPISQCPTISKNPLDLYRLYMYTKDRGGFLECTNKKAWKDIAAQLGIGPSSSGAYTLKKHYGKNLLPFECHFERGGVDPAPILSQVEAQSKKKGKNAQDRPARAPSPGSQDSRDSFTGNSQDGYPGPGPGYPPSYNNYPPGGDPRQAPPQHPGMGGPPGQGYPPAYPPAQRPPGHEGYGGPPGTPGAPGYNNYPGQGGPPPAWRGQYDQNAGPPTTGNDMYNRGWGGSGGYPPRPGYPQGGPPTSSSGTPPPSNYPPTSQPYDQYQKGGMGPGNGPQPGGPPGSGPSGPPGGMPPQGPRMMMRPNQQMQVAGAPGSHPVILRANSPATPGTIQDTLPPALPVQRIPNPHGYAGGASPGGPMPPPGSGGGMYTGGPPTSRPSGPPNASVPPSGPPGQPPMPSRGPGYPGPYGGPPGPRPMYPGSPGWGGRFSGPGPQYGGPGPGPQYGGPPGGPRPGPYGPQYSPGPATNSWTGPQRPGTRPPYRPDQMRGPPQRPMAPGRREIYNFPIDSLESTQPLLMKRKKLTKVDVQPVEGWRLVMALRSGLMMESTWALDTINILLYDDNSVAYFGLGNMPGLVEALIEHWRASLIAVFDVARDLELNNPKTELQRKRKREKIEKSSQGLKWYEKKPAIVEDEAGLGIPESDLLRRGEKVRILHHQPRDFTTEARFSEKDFEFDDREDELFVIDDERDWDCAAEGFHSGEELWAAGGGAETVHIFPADEERRALPFVRVLKDLRSNPVDSPKKTLKDNSDGLKSDSSVSPGKKHGKRVREEWKVLPAKPEDKTDKEKIDKNCEKSSSQPSPVVIKPELNESAVKTELACEKDNEKETDPLEVLRERTGIIIQGGLGFESRWSKTVLEDENFQPDCASLNLVKESQDNLGKRAVVVSTIFRNLSFVPGNETLLSSNPGFLAICGKMLLHYHWHPARTSKQRNYDRGEEEDFSESCTSLGEQQEWWWEHLQVIRENVMVAIANISGHMDLTGQPECLVRPLLSGLLEWAVSPSATAQDPFPNVGPNSPISPQRLAIESLCKLCVQEANVDLLLSTPPFSRIEKLCGFLSKKLYRSEDQVLREFAINLLFYFSQADSGVARTIALQDTTVSLLIGFIEQAESNALIVAQQHGVNALRDNPDSMGTSLDMLRRAANTLNHLARHTDNKALFVRQEQRLLNLVMSQILDQGVASIISQVLFQVSST